MSLIATKSNADSGGRAINALLDSHQVQNSNFHVFTSLGSARYLSAMRYASAVVGNSSSGLYEAPIFGVPVVNVGDRQKGRLCPDNVINCRLTFDDIVSSVKKAISDDFTRIARQAKNPYGSGETSQSIMGHIKAYLESGQAAAPLAKSFYDIT